MSKKSWAIPSASSIIGLGFVIFSFFTGEAINETHVKLLDYLLIMTLGSGAIGAANKGYKSYNDFCKKKEKIT